MQAVVWIEPGRVEVRDIREPDLSDPHGAIVRVTATSICGSDLHLYHATIPVMPGTVLGHEAVGVVEAVGARVERVRVGERVLLPAVIGCGFCRSCRQAYPVDCETLPMKVLGVSPLLPGTQAELVAVPYADFNLWVLPPEVADVDALPLTDVFPTGLFAAENARIAPGDTVVVIGCGPVGLCAIQCAQLYGAALVIAVDRVPERLDWAKRLGAQAIPADDDVAPRVRNLTQGRGADAVIEAVGSEKTLHLALDLLRTGGRLSMVGVLVKEDVRLPLGTAFLKDVTLRVGLVNVPRYLPALFSLLHKHRLRAGAMITHVLSLADAARAYAMFDRKEQGCIKLCLRP